MWLSVKDQCRLGLYPAVTGLNLKLWNAQPQAAQSSAETGRALRGFVYANLITRLQPELLTTFLFMVHLHYHLVM